MDGFINLKKNRGMTSFKCVAAVRRILGEKKVGHAGTLDPEAEGVLPICVGQASKCSEYFLRMKKSYRAEITFGFSTDTMDIWGTERSGYDGELSWLSEERVKNALDNFKGEIKQIPSMFSAIKKDGVPLYKLARQGIETEIQARSVNVYDIALISFSQQTAESLPKAVIDVTCSKGTYVRSICNDLGEVLGCFAVMSALCRTSYGDMMYNDAVTVEELENAVKGGEVQKHLLPLEFVLKDFPALRLSDTEVKRYIQGKTVLRQIGANDFTVESGDEIVLYAASCDKVFAVAKAEVQEDGKVKLCSHKFFGL